jgi:acetyl esterase/lipase
MAVKPVLRRQKNVARARRSFARLTRILTRPPAHTVHLGDTKLRGEWVWVSKARHRGVILYLHGGGYIMGSPQTHRAMVARLSRLSGLRAFVPDYRLAPEHPFPAALEDARAAWGRLIDLGYRPDEIVIGGDSAGGGLALALLAQLCQAGQPPRALFAFSPWTDLTLAGGSMTENAEADVLFPAYRAAELRDMIVSSKKASDPAASPLFAKFPDCPPVFMQCSQTEILRDDTLRMGKRLRGFGAEVTVQVLPGRPHVWQLFDRLLPEARQALRETAAFIAAVFPAPRSTDS